MPRAHHDQVEAYRRADRVAELVEGKRFGGRPEVRREFGKVGFAKVAGDDVTLGLRLGVHIGAGGARRLEGDEGLLRRVDLVLGCVGRQPDGGLFEADGELAAAGAFLPQLQDIDPVAYLDRLGNLAGPHLFDRRP